MSIVDIYILSEKYTHSPKWMDVLCSKSRKTNGSDLGKTLIVYAINCWPMFLILSAMGLHKLNIFYIAYLRFRPTSAR